MNEYQTKDIVSSILERMGYNTLKKDADNGNNIEMYINFIKHKKEKYNDLVEFINYFL